ncbi:hypothetical protein BT96DRAFT_948454 [Gymnopus androsaceus JB14]|uniref:Uncharacterized protein n=1 Tax=Gymnopus androsaceus JB14 TaxID=1447944 RepID=A0A6A4GQ49_9AGAR|nr:hypothetical protein BT96DRAFT_948454 [Gymnopus androsaceus JB14]
MSRSRRGGYNLRSALGWNAQQWSDVQSFIKEIVINNLDISKPLTKQETQKMSAVHQEVLSAFPFLVIYSDLWPIDDLVRARLGYEKKRLQREQTAKLVEESRVQARAAARRAALAAVDLALSTSS